MQKFNIAAIPGDGIGNDVMNEGIKVLNKYAQLKGNLEFNIDFFPWGCEYYLETGKMMDDNGLEILKNYDAILLGAVGYPSVPDHISLHELLIKIRQGFDQYINLRPIKLLKGAPCPIKGKKPEDIDFVVVRENVEGEYSNVGGLRFEGKPEEIAVQTSVFTRKNTEKVMRYAFELANKSKGNKKLTNVTKSNALNYSMVFWDKIFNQLSKEYEDVNVESNHVDAVTMYFVQKPENYNVLVASNLFGDIITDLGAALQGGLGFAASANLNPEGEYPSMFEPVHGSAPDIAGKGAANPIAMIWTIKLMLDELTKDDESEKILAAITDALAEGKYLTPDLGGTKTTEQVGDNICAVLENIMK